MNHDQRRTLSFQPKGCLTCVTKHTFFLRDFTCPKVLLAIWIRPDTTQLSTLSCVLFGPDAILIIYTISFGIPWMRRTDVDLRGKVRSGLKTFLILVSRELSYFLFYIPLNYLLFWKSNWNSRILIFLPNSKCFNLILSLVYVISPLIKEIDSIMTRGWALFQQLVPDTDFQFSIIIDLQSL